MTLSQDTGGMGLGAVQGRTVSQVAPAGPRRWEPMPEVCQWGLDACFANMCWQNL